MVRRSLRSRSLRRVAVKTPGGKVVTHFRKRKPRQGRCSATGQTLKGVPRARPTKMRHLAKTQKRPQRPFGGVLSSAGMRAALKQRARDADAAEGD